MNIYHLTTGTLRARVSRYTQDYVYLELHFLGQEPTFKTLTRDSFQGLDKWVEDNYDIDKSKQTINN